jgi:alkanesulfonate monooxygenase SsuD/methylene tetrahydromethanopterin reductase-like flavin-dependent oxidoreductase (luciferase family)
MNWILHHDLRAPDFGTPRQALFSEALDMCAWADAQGGPRVVISEHHGSPDGYLPSPFVFGGAVAARTAQMRILVSALVLTLRDPVSAAEDALVLDVLSGGRLELTLAAGYVPAECEMFGVPYDTRGAVFATKAAAFIEALTGEPFTYEGRTIQVTPGPVQRPRPFVIFGGSAPKRAARLGDAYLPPVADQALADAYVAECRRLGKGDGILLWPDGPMWVFVTDDPDRSWAQIGPHAMHETNGYGAWSVYQPNANPWRPVTSVEEVRRSGLYAVVTPDECVALARALDPRAGLTLKPLVGGLDPAIGWPSLELFVNKVLPRLKEPVVVGG